MSVKIGWKVFQVICILQLLLIAVLLTVSAGRLFFSQNVLLHGIEIACYLIIFWFVYFGLALLNYNFPDGPLSVAQKRKFNWLFLLNFLMIALLFAQMLSEWQVMRTLLNKQSFAVYIRADPFLLIYCFVFLLHLLFLGGIYRLRRTIHNNTIGKWDREF